MTWTLSFTPSGDHVDNTGSLQDGIYDLTLNASAISGTGGSMTGGNQTITFVRLYGDISGDVSGPPGSNTAAVNNTDLNKFKQAFAPSGGTYNAAFDIINNCTTINNSDLNPFKKRFTELFTW